jgi:2-succinyl-5-enolpyruvyl-6-hydroxy-3-cyclohexene-1-carboxylate synthase
VSSTVVRIQKSDGSLSPVSPTSTVLTSLPAGIASYLAVAVDNDGGGIFSFLPQAPLPEFETLFGTPHGLDLVAVARAHGVEAERIDDITKLPAALTDARTSPGVHILVVPVNRSTTVARHRALWDAVATALGRR